MRTLLAILLSLVFVAPSGAQTRDLRVGLTLDTVLAPGTTHDYHLQLRGQESFKLTVVQNGVDVVVEVRNARDSVLLSIDSPNGRNGPEPVEYFAPRPERLTVRVRPFDVNEPAGSYRLQVDAIRNRGATSQLLVERKQLRDAAARWLLDRATIIASLEEMASTAPMAGLDALAERVRVIGLGEATHGSREFNDARLAITKRLIERHGYRVVAIEASALRLSEHTAIDAGWIGRRTQHQLIEWVRRFNATHPRDSVRVVGLDAQDFVHALPLIRRFLASAYGSAMTARWDTIARELAAADSQSSVFGNSDVAPDIGNALRELLAIMHLDAPALAQRFGNDAAVAIRAVEILTQFADFNSNRQTPPRHSRDWYMAVNLLRVLRPDVKAVMWQHNAHVAKVAARTTGGFLQQMLGCDYAAIGLTFGSGSFVAQIPNDVQDRLAVSTLPAAPDESIEGVIGSLGRGNQLVLWGCDVDKARAPEWLQTQQRMHWVGALFAPGTPAREAFQPFDLLANFDGVLYLPTVTADEIFLDRPAIPARR